MERSRSYEYEERLEAKPSSCSLHRRSSTSSGESGTPLRHEKGLSRKRLSNQFIRLEYEDLTIWLAERIAAAEDPKLLESWRHMFTLVALSIHLRTQRQFKDVLDEYRAVDPRATRHKPFFKQPSTAAIPAGCNWGEASKPEILVEQNPEGVLSTRCSVFMNGQLQQLMTTCGFSRLPRTFLEEAKEIKGRHGLAMHVPPYDEVPVDVYYRDKYNQPAVKRSWQTCFKKQPVIDHYFRTLVMVYAYTCHKDDAPEGKFDSILWTVGNKAKRKVVGAPETEGKVFVRCYNDIPFHDIDMLVPGSSPNPTIIDVALILVPFLVGLIMSLYKIITLMTERKGWDDTTNLLVILLAIVGPFTISFKTYSQAANKMTAYRLRLSQMLYDHTLSANRGVMVQLVADAAEQEKKEFVLAYTVLLLSAEPLSMEGVRKQADNLLKLMDPSSDVQFDANDACSELVEAGVARVLPSGHLEALHPTEARDKIVLEDLI